MKTLTANYPGTCRKCGARFPAGTKINWERGGRSEHVECPAKSAPAPDAPLVGIAPPRPTGKVNRKPGACVDCGAWVASGAGLLIFCPEDSGCVEHHDFSGYHVACADPTACRGRKVENRAARKAASADAAVKAAEKKAAEAAASAAYKTEKDRLTEGLVESSVGPEFLLPRPPCAAADPNGFYRRALYVVPAAAADGTTPAYVVETADGHDDWRVVYWALPEVARAWRLAHAEKCGIDRARAAEFLAKYAGCAGADVYREVLDSVPEDGGVLGPVAVAL